jgi:hypothetical protein
MGSETALEFLERLQATSGTSSPLASEALRQVPQVAGASLGTHSRMTCRADRPNEASRWEVSSAIGEHRQAREVKLTSEPAVYQCVPHGAESGAPIPRTRSRGRRSAVAGRRSRGQEG